MGQHYGRLAYLVCDHPAADGLRCPAFLIPTNLADPGGVGAIFAHRVDAQVQGRAAGWAVTEARVSCPEHAVPGRPATVETVPLPGLMDTIP